MSSIKIHPYLMARLIAVQQAFNQPFLRPALVANTGAIMPPAQKHGNNWKAVVKEEEGDGSQGGGRGTMRGHRGKNAAHAKAAMRKLARR